MILGTPEEGGDSKLFPEMLSAIYTDHLKTSKKLIFEAFAEFDNLYGSPTITIFLIKSYSYDENCFHNNSTYLKIGYGCASQGLALTYQLVMV